MIDQTTKAGKSSADEKIPNVLKKYFNINGNNGFQLVDSTTLNQFLIKYASNGYVIISAYRNDNSAEDNDKQTISLINDIKNEGYKYISTYGSCQANSSDNADYKPSLIVCNYNRKGESLNFEDLKTFAIKMCEKYGTNEIFYSSVPTNIVDQNEKTGFPLNHTEKSECIRLNPSPATLNERMRRDASGEIWLEEDKHGNKKWWIKITHFQNMETF